MRPLRVVRARMEPMTLTDGIMQSGLLWCSLIITPSNPTSVQYCSSSKYMPYSAWARSGLKCSLENIKLL